MVNVLRRFGFLAAVGIVVAVLAFAALGKGFLSHDHASTAGRPKQAAPTVVTAPIATRTFHDAIQTIGTAEARESITISAKVTDVISRLDFDSGDKVSAGQVLVELASIEQAADLDEARATLAARKADYDRINTLGDKGFASPASIESSRAAFEEAQARVQALESRISDRVIRAPFSGVMGLRTASPGQLVRPGDAIGTLDDTSEIKLDFVVAESQLAAVKPGAEIVAGAAAFPNVKFPGRVNQIDSRVDPATRTLRVRAFIPNRDGRLKPGMLMTVELRSGERTALAAPEVALLERADGSRLLRVGEGDVVHETPVVTGRRSDGFVEIVSGLTAGDRIVVEGVQRARDGQKVKVETVDVVAGGSASGASK